MFNIKNEIASVGYEKNNQKFLSNGGVEIYFGNVFLPAESGKLPTIKNKLRKILVDFGLCQTCMEINQKSEYIKVWYRDPQATELKKLFLPLRRDNRTKESQAIELVISLEGCSCSPPKITREIKTYTGLTKLLYQEFIQPTESSSMVDNSPFNVIEIIIRRGNLAASEPLQCIFRGEVG